MGKSELWKHLITTKNKGEIRADNNMEPIITENIWGPKIQRNWPDVTNITTNLALITDLVLWFV